MSEVFRKLISIVKGALRLNKSRKSLVNSSIRKELSSKGKDASRRRQKERTRLDSAAPVRKEQGQKNPRKNTAPAKPKKTPQPKIQKKSFQPPKALPMPELIEIEPAEGKKRFCDFPLAPEVLAGTQQLGFKYCSVIQEKAIPYAEELLSKYPMLAASQYEEIMQNKFTKSSSFILNPYTSESSLGSLAVTNAQSDSKTRPVSKEMAETFFEKENDVRYAVAFNKKRVNNKTILVRLRSEEMCLIAAESYAHLGDTENALRLLNALREKRITQNFTPYTEENLPEVYTQLITEDATGKPLDKLMSAILCERRKEFFIEGDRWFELKRNGRPEFWVANNGKKYVTEKYLYTYPINKSDIDLYPGLVIQNPGYVE